jgi:hypothetical protein
MKHILRGTLAMLAGLLLVVLAGCSGGSSDMVTPPPPSGDTGRIRMAFKWPDDAASRVMPTLTRSLYVTIANNDGTGNGDTAGLADYVQGATTGQIEFNAVPVGTYTVSASAWDKTGGPLPGNGSLGAASNVSVAVSKGGTNSATLELSEQIVKITLYQPTHIAPGGNSTPSVFAYYNGDVANGYSIANTKCNWSYVKNGGAKATLTLTTGKVTVDPTSPFGVGVTVNLTARHKVYTTATDTGTIRVDSN